MMSILGVCDLATRDAEDEHLIWWMDEGGLALRAVFTNSMRFTVGPATLTVKDKQGNIVSPAESDWRHHIAFRFFRFAQTTDDLFDAYRNMYLAFEVLLSSKYPKQSAEAEVDWIRRALQSAYEALRLETVVGSKCSDSGEVIVSKIYQHARLPLFHAKDGRRFFAPQDTTSERQAIADALALLTLVVIRMATVWCAARRPSGGVVFGWVYANVREMLAKCSARASRYDAEFDPNEKDLTHSRFVSAAQLDCRLAPEFERDGAPAVLAVGMGPELLKASPLRRVELVDSAPVAAHILEAPVELDGVNRFESLMHVRGVNNSQPRSWFRQ